MKHDHTRWRFVIPRITLVLTMALLLARFFQLQVLEYRAYQLLARDQHEVQAALIPKRGTIFLRDVSDGTLHPFAKDRDVWQVYAVPKDLEDPKMAAQELAKLLQIPEEELLAKLSRTSSSYALLHKDVSWEAVQELRKKHLHAIGFSQGRTRFYPENGLGGQVFGFVGLDNQEERVGRYGIEGFYNKLLSGTNGSLIMEKDAFGRRLTIGTIQLQEARNGSDLVLTLDRTIQFAACKKIREAVSTYDATGGSILVMNPENGAIYAMCSTPDFDPANYWEVWHLRDLNNATIFSSFEPGSTFKPITLAAGIDTGKIFPNTTYVDSGVELVDEYALKNSDKKAHGTQTMSQVLEKSLNTGTIFVQRLLGREILQSYVKAFGFGEKIGIELQTEGKTDITSLEKPGKIFSATASFGQGITVHALQMVSAYAALGNGGRLYRPHIVQEIVHPDGRRESIEPQLIRQVITPRTSRLISGMMVNVVEKGHGKRASVSGYYVAGKTGTAQIPNPNGSGYLKDAAIGSFVGFAPADHPKFVMMVKIDRPRKAEFAESSAAPVFGDMAKFLLSYFHIPLERSIKKAVLDVPTETHVSSTGQVR